MMMMVIIIICPKNHVQFLVSVPLAQRSPTGGPLTTNGPRENFGGPWRNLDVICSFYVYYTVSLYSDAVTSLEPRIHKIISNKQQQISH
jgi:hypothetical protein